MIIDSTSTKSLTKITPKTTAVTPIYEKMMVSEKDMKVNEKKRDDAIEDVTMRSFRYIFFIRSSEVKIRMAPIIAEKTAKNIPNQG